MNGGMKGATTPQDGDYGHNDDGDGDDHNNDKDDHDHDNDHNEDGCEVCFSGLYIDEPDSPFLLGSFCDMF